MARLTATVDVPEVSGAEAGGGAGRPRGTRMRTAISPSVCIRPRRKLGNGNRWTTSSYRSRW